MFLNRVPTLYALVGAEDTVGTLEADFARLAKTLSVANQLTAFFVAGGLWISSGGSGQADSSNSSDHCKYVGGVGVEAQRMYHEMKLLCSSVPSPRAINPTDVGHAYQPQLARGPDPNQTTQQR